MGPERQHRGDELLLTYGSQTQSSLGSNVFRRDEDDDGLRARGCGPWDSITFALAVFLTRPQAEHQIGATSVVPDSARNVTAEARLA
jgi:hypothetical protein